LGLFFVLLQYNNFKSKTMNIQIQAVNFSADKKLISLVEEKLNMLTKFYDNLIEADVYLKVQKSSDKDNKHFELRLGVPGEDIVVKKVSDNFENALNQVVSTSKKILIKYKEKQRKN